MCSTCAEVLFGTKMRVTQLWGPQNLDILMRWFLNQLTAVEAPLWALLPKPTTWEPKPPLAGLDIHLLLEKLCSPCSGFGSDVMAFGNESYSGALTVQSADLGTISEDLNTRPSYEPGCNVLLRSLTWTQCEWKRMKYKPVKINFLIYSHILQSIKLTISRSPMLSTAPHVSLACKRHDLLLRNENRQQTLRNDNLWVTLAKNMIHKWADLDKRPVKWLAYSI